MARGKWWRERHIGGRYAPRLLPVWPVAISAVLVAIMLGAGIYFGLRAIAVPHPGPNGGPAVIDSLDVIKTTITVAGFIGAVLVGVYGYRKQRLVEGDARRADAEQLAQRYTTAAEQLGHEKAAVRLAGVYAMARLADDWVEQRQVCIDVLCAYLRMPYETDPDSDKHREGEREVRLTTTRIIRDHLQYPGSPTTWCGRDLDFTNATFDGSSFADAKFTGGEVYFSKAKFTGDITNFDDVEFSGGGVAFFGAKFTSNSLLFRNAKFTGGLVVFESAEFNGDANFDYAEFTSGSILFEAAKYTGGEVSFDNAEFSPGCRIIWGPFEPPPAWTALQEQNR